MSTTSTKIHPSGSPYGSPPTEIRIATSVNEKRVFVGRIVHSKSRTELEISDNAALGILEDGRIAFIDNEVTSAEGISQKYSGFEDASYKILSQLQFLFPGLIDSHLHACQWPNMAIGMEVDLKAWIEEYTDPIEVSYSDSNKARCIYSELVQKELDLGTTTCTYNSTIHY
jgi:guanine deaminase